MLAELLAHPGVTEDCRLGSPVGFAALHGGSLERNTAEIARDAAQRSGGSLYAVAQPDDLRWHVPSAAFDPAESSALSRFLDHVDVVVAIHGYGRPGLFTTVLLGGRNRGMAERMSRVLAGHLPDYVFETDLGAIPAPLRGQNPSNPVNRTPATGVQVELPPRIRGLGPHWDDHSGRCPHTEALVAGLAEVASYL